MTAIVLLAHGSPDSRSAQAARALARSVTEFLDTRTESAFLQHDEASLVEVIGGLAADGHASVSVVPLLLTPAFHARTDVPAAVALARTYADIRVTAPLGPHPRFLEAISRHLPDGPHVLAAAGTSHVEGRQVCDALAAEWATQSGQPVRVGFAGQYIPSVTQALDEIETLTRREASIGLFMLFPGVLADRAMEAADRRAISLPLCTSPEILDVIRERITSEVLAGAT